MIDPKVNGGISGHLNYDTELIKILENKIKELMTDYPVNDVRIQLADITDKRWKNYNGNSKKESVKV